MCKMDGIYYFRNLQASEKEKNGITDDNFDLQKIKTLNTQTQYNGAYLKNTVGYQNNKFFNNLYVSSMRV